MTDITTIYLHSIGRDNTVIPTLEYGITSEPDSLILYHHGLYEERYKILNLTEDTLTIRLSESIVNLSENGKDIEFPYGDCLKPIYTYIRINHSTIPIE